MSDEPELEVDTEVEDVQLDALASNGPVGRVRGYPPGNPLHISAEEPSLRKQEEAKFGREVAATRAWARATEHRAKKGNPKAPGQKASSTRRERPSSASDFKETAMAQGIRSAAKGKTKADLEKWARSLQFAHAMVAMKLENQDFAISEEEALLLTEAVTDLLEYYNIKLKGQAGAWGALVYAVGMVYGPRIGALVISRMKTPQVQGQ